MIRRSFLSTLTLGGLFGVAGTATAHAASDDAGAFFPSSFPLPDGFQPEGIAIGPGPFAFFGSRAVTARSTAPRWSPDAAGCSVPVRVRRRWA